jgi:hypothetical protein
LIRIIKRTMRDKIESMMLKEAKTKFAVFVDV